MPVTLQPDERDALWQQISSNFTLLSDLELAMDKGDEESCYKIGRKIADGLRLIIDGGLGWQPRSATPTVLTLPDLELRQIMGRMKEQAVTLYESKRPEAEASQAEMDEIAAVRAAAATVFDHTRP